MAPFALGLYITWLILAFGVRTAVQRHRTGDGGWRRPTGGPRSVTWWASVLFAVALVAGIAAPVAELLGFDEIDALDVPLLRVAGAIIAVAGIAATLLAQASMGDAWRIGVQADERTELVTNGPFSMVRNPIFTAMLVTAVGLGMMVPNAIAVAGVLALLATVELHVRLIEEPHLESTHQASYRTYASRAGRFVPQLSRWRSGSAPSANPPP